MHDKRVYSNLWLFRTLRAKHVVVKLFDICCHVRLLYRESEQVSLLPDLFCQCQIQKEDCFPRAFPLQISVRLRSDQFCVSPETFPVHECLYFY